MARRGSRTGDSSGDIGSASSTVFTDLPPVTAQEEDDMESRRISPSPKNSELAVDDVNASDSRGRTLVYKAASKGNTEIVEWLCAKGNDVNLPNLAGTTPLHVASYNGHLETVDWLCKNGSNIHAVTNFGQTVRHCVLYHNLGHSR